MRLNGWFGFGRNGSRLRAFSESGRGIMRRDQTERVAIPEINIAKLGFANARGIL